MCLILREMLLHPDVPILTAQSDAHIHDIMTRNNSWVIKDANNTTYIHWHAMRFLFNQRWPFKPLAWLMKFKPFMGLGNTTYHWIAENRGTMSRVTAWALAWRRISLRPTRIGGLLAAFFLLAVTVYNISGLAGFSKLRPSVIDAAVKLTRLDQKWDMFAPHPLTQSVFQQIPGKSRDGSELNLYPTTQTNPTWEPPTYLAPIHAGYRWRKYMGIVGSHKNNVVRNSFGHFLCHSHNAKLPALSEQQLATFEIYTVKRLTNTTGAPRVRTRIKRDSCLHFTDVTTKRCATAIRLRDRVIKGTRTTLSINYFKHGAIRMYLRLTTRGRKIYSARNADFSKRKKHIGIGQVINQCGKTRQ